MPRFWKADACRKWKSYAIKRRMAHYRWLTKRQRPLLRKLLKKARQDANLDQREAGELLGQDQSFISKVESGKRQLEFTEVEHLAHIYGKPLSFFEIMPRLKRKRETRRLPAGAYQSNTVPARD